MSIISRLHRLYEKELERVREKKKKEDITTLKKEADRLYWRALELRNTHRIVSIVCAQKAIQIYKKLIDLFLEQGATGDATRGFTKRVRELEDMLENEFSKEEIERARGLSEGDPFYVQAERMLEKAMEKRNLARIEAIAFALKAMKGFEVAAYLYHRDGEQEKEERAKKKTREVEEFLSRFSQEEIARAQELGEGQHLM